MLINGCSLFSSESNRDKIFSLPILKNHFTPFILWSVSIGNGTGDFYSKLHPTCKNSIIYAADRRGIVKAININNGKEIWSVNLSKKENWFFSSSALLSSGITENNGRIYIGSEKANIYALDINDGSVVWQVHITGEVLSHPVVNNDIILIYTNNSQLLCLDKNNGKVKWTVYLSNPVFSLRGKSTPTIENDIAIVGDDNGYVSSISIKTGKIIWQQRISQKIGKSEVDRLSDVDTTPIIIDNIIYIIAYNGELAALDLYSGHIIWSRQLGSINDLLIDENCIFLIDQNNRLLSLNIEDGVILWIKNDFPNRILTSPVLHKGNLIVGDNKGYIYWINSKNGYCVTQKKIDSSGFLTSPIIANDKLLIQSRNGTLYAIVN